MKKEKNWGKTFVSIWTIPFVDGVQTLHPSKFQDQQRYLDATVLLFSPHDYHCFIMLKNLCSIKLLKWVNMGELFQNMYQDYIVGGSTLELPWNSRFRNPLCWQRKRRKCEENGCSDHAFIVRIVRVDIDFEWNIYPILEYPSVIGDGKKFPWFTTPDIFYQFRSRLLKQMLQELGACARWFFISKLNLKNTE